MSHVFLAPHNDDETLFAAYTVQRVQPLVVVCTRSRADYRRRESETAEALYRLTGSGAYEQWTHSDWKPEWDLLGRAIADLAAEHDQVWAPRPNPERNGHTPGKDPRPGWGVLQHDRIGELALDAFGPERTNYYCLYTRWGGRDTEGEEVVPTAMEVARKFEALSQYVSQMESEATRPWFYDQLDMREWVVA